MVTTSTKKRIKEKMFFLLQAVVLVLTGFLLSFFLPIVLNLVISYSVVFQINDEIQYILTIFCFGLCIPINYYVLTPLEWIPFFFKTVLVGFQLLPTLIVFYFAVTNQGSESDTAVDKDPNLYFLMLMTSLILGYVFSFFIYLKPKNCK